jgi:2-phospho-L-lactate/phosphoenolpyruvate guanylyltransferase
VQGRIVQVQGTVRRFDPDTRRGDVLLDDGQVLTYDAAAFAPSGLRLLRLGQRVRLRVDDTGTVVFLTMSTLPDPGE